jgi:hypothetical protein
MVTRKEFIGNIKALKVVDTKLRDDLERNSVNKDIAFLNEIISVRKQVSDNIRSQWDKLDPVVKITTLPYMIYAILTTKRINREIIKYILRKYDL